MAARCRWCDRFLSPADAAARRGLCPACRRLLARAVAERPRKAPKGGPPEGTGRRRR